MKKILVALLSLSLLLSGCDDAGQAQCPGGTLPPDEPEQSQNNPPDATGQTDPDDSPDQGDQNDAPAEPGFDYEQALIDYMGAEYFAGKAFMRADDAQILGQLCAVFQIGTNTAEKFTTEQWLAVDANGAVYRYDVALDEWSAFVHAASIADCVYMLGEVYGDSFAAEYYDTPEEERQAIYDHADAAYDGSPAMLIPAGEPVPDGYFSDPAAASYFPVYNFASIDEINAHLSLYFTQRYIDENQWRLAQNFFEIDGALYLTRGGRGYGTTSIDFDAVDYDNMQNNALVVPTLDHGEPFIKLRVVFAEENGGLKIDSDNYIAMYEMYQISDAVAELAVPDFLAFARDNEELTGAGDFAPVGTEPYHYGVTYLGDYSDELPEYAALLAQLGYAVVIDGYEGFYSFEYYGGDYTVTVYAYHLNEQEGIRVEVGKVEAVG